jgi:hypothetical protein
MPKGKAQADEKAQHTCKYVSILRRFATPPLGIRCIFGIDSKKIIVNAEYICQEHLTVIFLVLLQRAIGVRFLNATL